MYFSLCADFNKFVLFTCNILTGWCTLHYSPSRILFHPLWEQYNVHYQKKSALIHFNIFCSGLNKLRHIYLVTFWLVFTWNVDQYEFRYKWSTINSCKAICFTQGCSGCFRNHWWQFHYIIFYNIYYILLLRTIKKYYIIRTYRCS